ncbi:hypothetical protein D3C81_1310510 [compost metagenome]
MHGAGGADEVVGIADVHCTLDDLLLVRLEELALAARDFLAVLAQAHHLDGAVATERGEGALAHRIVEHAAGDGDFAGDGLVLGIDHGDRGGRGEVVDVDEAVVGAGAQAEALGQRLGALGRDHHFPVRRQGRGVPGGQHVGAGATGTARIEQVGAVQQLAIAAQGRGRGEAGADHAEELLLVRIDDHHAAGDEAVELHIDHVGAVRAGRERQGGLADTGVRR